MKEPQHRALTLTINQQQLEQIIAGLQLLVTQNTVDPQFDNKDVFFVKATDTLQMLTEINDDPESQHLTHGLCL